MKKLFRSISEADDVEPHRLQLVTSKIKEDDLEAFRIILLGSSESGKSTICKQFLAYSKNNSNEYFRSFIPDLYENLRIGTLACLTEMTKQNKVLDNNFTRENIAEFHQFNKAFDPVTRKGYSSEFHQVIIRIWRDKNMQKIFGEMRHELHLPDGYEHLFQLSNIERYKEFTDFYPNLDDVIYCHSRTLGIAEWAFEFDKNRFVLVDTGGVKSERKKWQRTFESCSLMVYVVSLADYDETLSEDFEINRMKDSLEQYDKIINSYPFNRQKSVLLFNKSDLLEKGVNHKKLQLVFPNYKQQLDCQDIVESVIDFIKAEYLKLVKGELNRIVSKVCSANKKDQIVPLFEEILKKYF